MGFLGAIIIFSAVLWKDLRSKRQIKTLIITTFIVTILMFLAFLYEGYGTFSIIFSTLHIFIEYWAIIYIWKQMKINSGLPKCGILFIKGSCLALLISTFGPFMIGYLGATGLRETPIFDMTIYIYLHFQYNGWLFLFLIGIFLFILHRKGIRFSKQPIQISFWIYLISLIPWVFSAISEANLGMLGYVLAAIGILGQWFSIIILTWTLWRQREIFKRKFAPFTVVCLYFSFTFLLSKSLMELGLLSPPLAKMVFRTHSVIIGYLHLALLGFVSFFILTQFQMIGFLKNNKQRLAILVMISGFILNELFLFLSGLLYWINKTTLAYYNEGLLVAALMLTIGTAILLFTKQKEAHH